MSLTLSQIISRVSRKVQNASSKLGGQSELINIINEANRDLESRVDLISAKRTGTPRLIVNNIWQYPTPTDISYDKMIEAIFEDENDKVHKSQFQRSPAKFFFNMKNPYYNSGYGSGYSYGNSGAQGWQGFGYNGMGNMGNYFETIAVDFQNGSPFLMVNMIQGKPFVELNNLDEIDSNGTWSASTDTTNVRTDNQKYREGTGSVALDGNGGLTCGIVNSTMTAVDLTDYEGKGIITLDVEVPSTIPTSVTLRWGSDNANYWEKTVTVAQNGLAFIPGWNTLGFDWETATETGAPDVENVDYILVTFTNAAVTTSTFRVDNIQARLGRQCTLKYYSKYLVISNAGVRQENFSQGDDLTILNEKEVDMLVWTAARIANQQLRQYNESQRYEDELKRMIEDYKNFQPSQDEPSFISYYVV